jgi:hypothetical protein
MECSSCTRELDHCHGTLLTHADATVDCTETGCTDLDHVRHELIVRCRDEFVGCFCGAEAAADLAYAS